MNCSDVLHDFLDKQKLINNSIETIDYYNRRIGYFIKFVGDIDINCLTINNYNDYVFYLQDKITDKGTHLSSHTIKTTLNACKIFIKYSFDNGFLESDFYKDIRPYKVVKKSLIVLSYSQIDKLLNSQNSYSKVGCRNLLIISLMLDAGLRLNEVCELNVCDISLELNLIRVFGKGRKERLVPITDSISQYYKKYIYISNIQSGALFLDFDTNLRLTPSGISQIFRRIRKECNFDTLHPHYLRHTFATLFLVNGGDPIHLQLILGHTTLHMTEKYIHLAKQMTLTKQKQYSPLTNIPSKIIKKP